MLAEYLTRIGRQNQPTSMDKLDNMIYLDQAPMKLKLCLPKGVLKILSSDWPQLPWFHSYPEATQTGDWNVVVGCNFDCVHRLPKQIHPCSSLNDMVDATLQD